MSKHDDQLTSPELEAELAALDAALRGEDVGREHAELATLATALRETRPRPNEELVRSLDARAAQGFARKRARGRIEVVRRHRAFAVAAVALLAVAVVIPVGLSSRSSGDKSASDHAAEPSAVRRGDLAVAPAASPSASAGASTAAKAPSPGARQVEHTAALDVGVAPSSIQSAAQQVFTLASAFHGYVQQSSVSSGTGEQGGASFQLRVPSANLPGAIAALAHLGHVRSENEATNDVTEEMGSLQRSLGDAKAERQSLLAQLARSAEPEALETLKRKLQAVDTHIAQLTGSIQALTSRVVYTNVALSLTPERQAGAGAGDLTPGGALHDAGLILDTGLALLVLAAAVLVPLAVLASGALLALTATRRRLREQALDGG